MFINLRSLLVVAAVAVCMSAAASVASAQCDMGNKGGCEPYVQLALQATNNVTLAAVEIPCDDPGCMAAKQTTTNVMLAATEIPCENPSCGFLVQNSATSKLSNVGTPTLALAMLDVSGTDNATTGDAGLSSGPVLVSVMKSL